MIGARSPGSQCLDAVFSRRSRDLAVVPGGNAAEGPVTARIAAVRIQVQPSERRVADSSSTNRVPSASSL